MLKIRLQRIGRKNDPSFRVITVDSRKGPKAGKPTEVLGSYDPRRNSIAIKDERVKYWISKGAQVSDSMHNILVKEGVIKAKKIHVAKGKKKIKEEKKEEAKTEESKEPEVTEEKKEESKTEESKEPGMTEEKKEEVAPEKKEVI
mgnify:CR=1 FL=1|jgi:small subunit ribosomal protein S16|tara:strand:+ start:24724 stop:25158 length:435 start_codon:yes stop_codon:yes gene_type:complete